MAKKNENSGDWAGHADIMLSGRLCFLATHAATHQKIDAPPHDLIDLASIVPQVLIAFKGTIDTLATMKGDRR